MYGPTNYITKYIFLEPSKIQEGLKKSEEIDRDRPERKDKTQSTHMIIE